MGNRECCTLCISGTNNAMAEASKKMLPKESHWKGGEIATPGSQKSQSSWAVTPTRRSRIILPTRGRHLIMPPKKKVDLNQSMYVPKTNKLDEIDDPKEMKSSYSRKSLNRYGMNSAYKSKHLDSSY